MAPDRSLDEVLTRLQSRGTLTVEQVEAIREEFVEEPAAAPPATPRRNVIPEVIGYVGGALVFAAGVSLVAQNWDNFNQLTHLLLCAGTLGVLWIAAVALTLAAGGRRMLNTDRRASIRRLVAVLTALAVPVAALVAFTALEYTSPAAWESLGEWTGIIISSTAFTAACIGAWWVRGPLLTLAVAFSGGVLLMTVLGVLNTHAVNWIAPIVVVVMGAAWLWIAPRTLAVPVLSEALGFAWLVIGLMQHSMNDLNAPSALDRFYAPTDVVIATWLSRGLLIGVAVIAMVGFARGRDWPWAAGGVAAGVFAALSIGQGTMGWVVGLFIAGIVLLALSGLMIFLRTRGHMRSGAETPHSSSPLNST